ncbi:MAG: hypothetical protein ABSD44_12685 [Terracidiphilus sp.]
MIGTFFSRRGLPGISLAAAALLAVTAGTALAAEKPAAKAQAAVKATPLYGPRGVAPEAVKQGLLGSCFFHASIAALAYAAPEALRGAIHENPGGGYRVHFFDGPEEVVFPEDVDFGRTHSYDRSDGTWVAVLMRAYAQRTLRLSLVAAIQKSETIPAFTKPIALLLLDQSDLPLVAYDRAVRSVVQQDGALDKAMLKTRLAAQLAVLGVPATEAQLLDGFLDSQGFFDTLALDVQQNGEAFGAYKALGQGGVPERVFESFLGTGMTGLVADKKLVVEQLKNMRAGHLAMVAGTWETGESDATAKSNWWVPGHSYTVMDYDDAAQTVTLRNPWAAKPDPDGVFAIPLAVFFDGYESYTYAQAPAPSPAP